MLTAWCRFFDQKEKATLTDLLTMPATGPSKKHRLSGCDAKPGRRPQREGLGLRFRCRRQRARRVAHVSEPWQDSEGPDSEHHLGSRILLRIEGLLSLRESSEIFGAARGKRLRIVVVFFGTVTLDIL